MVDPLHKQQNRVEPGVDNCVQVGIRELVQSPSGMHHARRKERFPAFLLRFQEWGFPEIQQVFEIDGSHPYAGLVVAMNADAFLFRFEKKSALFPAGNNFEFNCRATGFLPERKHQRHGLQKIILEILCDGKKRILECDAPCFIDGRFPGFGGPGRIPAANFVHVIDPFSEFILFFCIHVGKTTPFFI
ncbi:hypothetical protein SDC9_177002 [bioreactor metagenome]|uniref:Uncharacterized protein n=1 Tax=bioreactor metagenome TaxID=1076179 RepID=A0A645GUW9_9ZZZZ